MVAIIDREKVNGPAKMTVRKLKLEKAGDFHQGHKHKVHHITAVVRGKVELIIGNNKPIEIEAPNYIFIDKDIPHKFTALENQCEFWCIFSTNDDNLTMQIPTEEGIGCEGCSAKCTS